jgi:hypothetical protein
VRLAFGLLLIGAMRNYGWALWPDELRGSASKMLGAMATLCLIGIVVYLAQSKAVTLAGAYYAFEETQTAICSAAYMVKSWPVPAGTSICSARLDFDLGAVGVMLLAFIAWRLCTSDSVQEQQEAGK